ncbi:MAG: (Fe-S)-binding protein [Spirochaetales bacterium]|nr:(Fe-S)-binding protein [Spirochaetales bacterium]
MDGLDLRARLDEFLAMPFELHEESVADPPVSDEAIMAALASVGKYSYKDEFNCSGCGYDTCRAFATAIVQGKAEKTMCLSYMRKLAQKKANALLKAMPSAAAVVDASLHIVECNRQFA